MPNKKAKTRKMERKKRHQEIKVWKRKEKLRKKELREGLKSTSKENMGK